MEDSNTGIEEQRQEAEDRRLETGDKIPSCLEQVGCNVIETRRIRVLFYRAVVDGKWLDNGIAAWTGLFNPNTPPYSHVEIWIPERAVHWDEHIPGKFTVRYVFEKSGVHPRHTDKPWKKHGNHNYVGQCYTSTMGALRQNPIGKREAATVDGVVIRPAWQLLTHPERWNYVEIALPVADWEIAVDYAKRRAAAGIRYDRRAILSFFLPVRWHSKTADICSETGFDFLIKARFFDGAISWSKRLKNKILAWFKKPADDNEVPSPRRLSKWVLTQPKRVTAEMAYHGKLEMKPVTSEQCD